MPSTIHKFLIHVPEVVNHSLTPMGQLTDEAQETRKKEFKKFRKNYSRISSREKFNEHIFKRSFNYFRSCHIKYKKIKRKHPS